MSLFACDSFGNKIFVGFYRHYKGGIYEVLGFGRHTEDETVLIHYIDVYGNTWFRPIDMWLETVEYNGESIVRFSYFNDFNAGLIAFGSEFDKHNTDRKD